MTTGGYMRLPLVVEKQCESPHLQAGPLQDNARLQ